MILRQRSTDLPELLKGRLLAEVAQAAPCPIWIIQENHLPKHILIALDGTLLAEHVLESALGFASVLKARVTLAKLTAPAGTVISDETGEANDNYHSKLYLDDVIRRHQRFIQGIDIFVESDVNYDQPQTRLSKLIMKHQCDMVALSANGVDGLSYLLNEAFLVKMFQGTRMALFVLTH